MPRKLRVPSYRRLKSRNLAFVEIEGKRTYLGKWESPESKDRYEEVVREWVANQNPPDLRDEITIMEVIAKYLDHCETYYGPLADNTTETANIRPALRSLNEEHGEELAADFGPLKLKTLRGVFANGHTGRKNTRTHINKQTARIVRMFKWAVGEELVRFEVYQALTTVEGLRAGRCKAPEGKKVQPIDEDAIETTLAELGPVVDHMVRIELLTGMRPGELCQLRPVDIDRLADVWLFRPPHHKNAFRGHDREVAIGPRAQAILKPYLLRGAEDYCFSPREAYRKHLAERRANRSTPGSCGNTSKGSSLEHIGEMYDVRSYRRAIHRACDRAGIPRWSPNRLRHSKATAVRAEFGLEHAQSCLGHAHARVTEVYAQRNRQLAIEVARATG